MAKPPPTLPFEQRPPSAASRGSSPKPTPSVEAIPSLEAADFVLAELADLDATERELKAGCDQELTLVREKWAAQMTLVCDGEQITFADRRQSLVEALEVFATEKRDEIFGQEKKSTALNHGEFGFKLSNPRLESLEDGPPKSYGKALDAIVEKLTAALGRLKLLFAGGDGQFLKVQLVLDRQALLAAAKKKTIGAAELRKAGLKYAPPADVFFVKPKAQEVASQSAAPPS
jgi:hypothetical protein